MKRAPALIAMAACSSAPAPAPKKAPDAPIEKPAAPAAGRATELAEIVIAAERVTRYAREPFQVDDAFESTVRACADELAPAAGRATDAHWVLGVSWGFSARVDDEIVADRSIEPSDPAPAGLAACVAERAAVDAGGEGHVDVLIAIRTRGWVDAHGAGRPIEEPSRALDYDVRAVVYRSCKTTWVDAYDDDLERAAATCIRELAPLRDRPVEVAWRVPFRTKGAGGCMGSDRANLAGGHTGPLPFAEPPAGLAECVAERVGSVYVSDGGSLEALVEITSEAFRETYRDHYSGSIGRGSP